MVSTWQDLAMLREKGHKPELPVIVTTDKRRCWSLSGVGCMTILHEAGKPMPVELLDGLSVILMVGNCERSAQVWRLMKAKDVAPADCASWCPCERSLTKTVGNCTDVSDVLRAIA